MFKKILLLISILLFSIKSFSVDNTPSQVVKGFYTMYVKKYVKENTLLENIIMDTPEILTYVSKDFVKKNIGADEFLQIEYVDTKEDLLNNINIISTKKIRDKAKVRVNLLPFANDFNFKLPDDYYVQILVTLKKEQDNWKIIKVKRLN